MTVVLSVAPHPDDEVIGAGPVSLALRGHGHDVHVLCVSLGRPSEHDRRAAEAAAAAAAGGWVLHLPPEPVAISAGDDLAAAERSLRALVARVAGEVGAEIVIGPGPHDAHHGHEVVARALRDALAGRAGTRWWAWATWGHLPVTNLVLPFGPDLLDEVLRVLEAYAGELVRADYRAAVVGAAQLGGALGPERVFGFGATRPSAEPFATVLCESVAARGRWAHTAPRVLDPADPLAGALDHARPTGWLSEPSPYRTTGARRAPWRLPGTRRRSDRSP